MEYEILKDACDGCGQCVDGCPFGAMGMEDGIAVILEHCTDCGACVELCPKGAIVRAGEVEAAVPGVRVEEYKNLLVFAEHRNGALVPVTFQLLAKARDLADRMGAKAEAVILGHGEDLKTFAEELIAHGADTVYLIEHELLKNYQTDVYTKSIVALAEQKKPEIMLFGATDIGSALAPMVANRLETGLASECIDLDYDDAAHLLVQTKPVYGGNIIATIVTPGHRPQIATVRPGVFRPLPRDDSRTGNTIEITPDLSTEDIKTELLKETPKPRVPVKLEDAEIIVAAGRGVGEKANLEMLRELAELLGAEMGVSRGVVDAGWLPAEYQIGLTGKMVSPKLYIACGISGAAQHMLGIRNADTIVAINNDPDAPIFRIADYGIVGDLREIIPAWVRELKERAQINLNPAAHAKK